MSTTSSKNFTTLYSGSGSVVPQGQYGNANVVSLLAAGTDGGNTVSNIVATGNVTTTAQMSATGNITTAGYFIGSVVGNVSGNVTAAGSNTQVQFNNNGVLGADADFTYNNSTNALTVAGNITGGNVAGTTVTATTVIGANVNGTQVNTNLVQGNIYAGNLLVTNSDSGSGGRGAIVLDGSQTIVGQDNAALGTNATVRAIRNQALELTTTNAGAPAVYVGKYVSGDPNFTGNVDVRSSNVGGYAGTGNINLSGNVYVSRDAQGANTTYGKANLIVTDNVSVAGVVSATGNIITDGFFVGNFTGNITGNLSVPGLNTEVLYNNSGNAGASAGLTFISASNALVSSGTVTAVGNVVGGNVTTAGQISATGNITTAYNINFTKTATLGVIDGQTHAAFAGGLLALASYNTGNTSGNAVITLDGSVGNVDIYSGSTLWNFNGSNGNLTLPGNTSAINYANGTSILSGLGSTYGNSNVSAYLASGTNTANIITTGNVAGGNISTTGKLGVTGNIDMTGSINIGGSTLVGNQALITFAGQPAYLASYNTGNTLGNSLVVADGANGKIQLYNPTVANDGWIFNNADGNLTLPGNTSAINYANGTSILSGITSSYGNANVANFLANYGSNTIVTTGNITAGNLIATNVTYTPQVESVATDLDLNTAGKINANGNLRVGDNNANTQIATHGTGDLILRTHEGDANQGSITIFDGANGNIALAPNGTGTVTTTTLSATGNITGGSVVVPNGSRYRGDFTAGGTAGRTFFQTTDTNTSASTFLSAIPGPNHTASPGTLGAATGLFSTNDAGNASIFGMYSYPTDAAIRSLSTGTGNINDITFKFGLGGTLAATITQGGNVVAVANLTSTQQTVVGTANVGTTGNIIMSGKNIATDMAFSPDGGTAATAATSRIVVGTGWAGNITHSAVQNRLLVQDTYNRTNTGTSSQLFAADPIVNLIGNVTNNSFRAQGVASRIRIGGGASANTIALTTSPGVPGSIAALQPNIDVGNVSPYNLGNTTVSHATLNGGFITPYLGSFIGNAYGMLPGALATSTGNAQQAGNITNYIGFSNQLSAGPYITGNVYAFYHGNISGSAEANATGVATAEAVRPATNYYAFRNDDPVAQVKLGSLRNYHEYQYSTATSGTVNIDKNNAQIQFINPTANVTIGDYQNFITTANDGTNNDSQADTVTLIIQQGATPYTVTMPTGNASIKYASGNSTVGATANAVTMVSISAFRSAANATIYLTTVSPEFT